MAGGAVIGATTTTAGRVGAIIGTEVAGNMAHGASMRVLFNAHDGKHLTEGLAQDMIVRGITGGIAGGVGIGASEIVSAAAHGAEKVLIHTTAGALISGTSGGLGCLLHNVISSRKIEKAHLAKYLLECNAS